jgi:hypothetical protein
MQLWPIEERKAAEQNTNPRQKRTHDASTSARLANHLAAHFFATACWKNVTIAIIEAAIKPAIATHICTI